ncbi:MAG: PP2C family protein-serine/threonine phosphatase [Acidimicrobiales bacterium]
MEDRRRPTEGAIWDLAAALAASVSPDDVALALSEKASHAVGASFSVAAFTDARGRRLRRMQPSALDADLAMRWESVDLDDRTPLGACVLLGRPVLVGSLAELRAQYPHLGDDRLHTRARATASFPLVGPDGTVLGGLGFGWREPQSFDERRLTRLRLVASVAGQALERVLAHERERKYLVAVDRAQVALLQDVFLPNLPAVTGLEAAASYLPTSGEPLGGDWYDVFTVVGRTYLVIGDVAGHGLDGAAVMAQVRNGVRAFASEHFSPAQVLERVNRMVCRLEPTATATMMVAIWEPASKSLVRANAGHPPPLRCRTGEFDYLTSPSAHVVLGAVPGQEYHDEHTVLRTGTTLLFFTDGLIEDRTSDLDTGMARLRRFAESLDDLAPQAVCDAVVTWRAGGSVRDDDICLLAIRVADPSGASARL